MKKIVFTFVCLSGLSLASIAQQPNNQGGQGQHTHQGGGGQGQGESKAQRLTGFMTTQLSLTADQQQKVGTLNTSKAQQIAAIRTKYKGGDTTAARTEVKAVRDKYNTDLKAILTPDQATKWEAVKQQKREEFQKAKAAGTTPANSEITPEDLN
jgi:protein CpxP